MSLNKRRILKLTQNCKSILLSNWKGNLHTIKADTEGRGEIHSSTVNYIFRRGKPYVWIPEKDLHNTNTVIDERGSFSVSNPFPGPLPHILHTMKVTPARVVITGDVVHITDERAELVQKSLQDWIRYEEKAVQESNYSVKGILSSSDPQSTSRSDNLRHLLDQSQHYVLYKFNPREFMFIDQDGSRNDVALEEMKTCKADPLSPFSAKLIDGVNKSEARRCAMTLFCFSHMNVRIKEAYMVGLDKKGFNILGETEEGWKEFKFKFQKEANDIESFCDKLVKMEEEVISDLKDSSGL